MKRIGIISTAVLSLTLGVAAPVFAQEQHDQQEEQKAKPAGEEKKTQPEKSAKQDEKPASQEQKNAKPAEKNELQQQNAKPAEKSESQQQNVKPAEKSESQQHASGRIPDDRYKASFGREHTFHVSQSDYNHHRFQYGGYTFGFVDAWPSNWLYTQNVYVIDINGVYYLCNPAYPGVNIALSFSL